MNMNNFLNPESPVMEFLRKISDIIILNVVFIISCIPVITIGAAITSLYTVTLQIAKLEDPHIWQTFWSAFRQNFRQSTLIWVICLVVIALLCLDFLFLQAQSSPFASYVQMAIWIGNLPVCECDPLYLSSSLPLYLYHWTVLEKCAAYVFGASSVHHSLFADRWTDRVWMPLFCSDLGHGFHAWADLRFFLHRSGKVVSVSPYFPDL